jgi:hypothetical protein
LKPRLLRFLYRGPVPVRTLSSHIYVSRQRVPHENALISTLRKYDIDIVRSLQEKMIELAVATLMCVPRDSTIAVGTEKCL